MFIANLNGIKKQGQLTYEKSEYSFDFSPAKPADITVMISYLHLGIDSETMLAQQVWGYNPYTVWVQKELKVPSYSTGELYLEETIQAGFSKSLDETEQWLTSYDESSGWICIGDNNVSLDDITVEFANNTLATLNEGKIKAIWLKPLFV
ncbi:hypothetical protein NYE69_12275 [Paenibacillus sp. FSL R5-0527]|uniref:hypothetical protein n=1 Tax=Paenibacillus TaxID=44249 RepID=UPI00097B7AC8|nr:hypothetical protein [Paenibacillus macerans]OMG45287.1 hypothetical protein BK140_33085 [Paenibacillus macerans]